MLTYVHIMPMLEIMLMIMLLSRMIITYVLCWPTLVLCSYDVMLTNIFSTFCTNAYSCLRCYQMLSPTNLSSIHEDGVLKVQRSCRFGKSSYHRGQRHRYLLDILLFSRLFYGLCPK